jgi:hypothetical protein
MLATPLQRSTHALLDSTVMTQMRPLPSLSLRVTAETCAYPVSSVHQELMVQSDLVLLTKHLNVLLVNIAQNIWHPLKQILVTLGTIAQMQESLHLLHL